MNFVVNEGEIVSLIGPNGAGKTTAFNVITGFLKPSEGEVRYRGTSLNGLKPHEVASLGLVRTFQRTSVFGAHTVFDNVLIGLHRQRPLDAARHAARIAARATSPSANCREARGKFSNLVGIEHHAHELAGSLPYGEQRLLGVALALAAKPSMLLLDEPVSGMNATETGALHAAPRQVRERGVTILLVEHDMPMVMGVSDRIVVLNYGRIIAEGPPAAIRENPEVIRAYLGQGRQAGGACLRSAISYAATAASRR